MPEDRADRPKDNGGAAQSGSSPSPQRPQDRLDSWKEIAAYLDRDVTTAQRWEKREGMPVHRHQHDRKGSAYAFRAELDEWAATRSALIANSHSGSPLAEAPGPAPASAPTSARQLMLMAAAVVAIVVALITVWIWRAGGAWQNPLAGANFQPITEWEGIEMAAAISGDGRFVAFLSDRDGQMDVWITQPGSGHFYNLTKGTMAELVNPSIRTLGFSPDNSQVTFWVRKPGDGKTADISVWAVPTLGGPPRQYLDGAAEYAWAPDARRLAYHTPGPGDPLFVVDGIPQQKGTPIFTAPPGLHSHFPIWSPDGRFIYFVQGTLPDKLDIWRVATTGGAPERITFHNALVSHPVIVDRRTLLYLATDPDGSGPWIYGVDLAKKVPTRLASGVERYTSLSASADGRRLTATTATLTRTLWRVKRTGGTGVLSTPTRIPLTTATGFSPRLGPDYILFASLAGNSESLWRVPLSEGMATELWRGHESRIAGGPAISPDGKHIAFSVRQQARTLLYTIDADGANVRIVTDALDLQGDPAWESSGDAITIAAMEAGVPRLFRVPLGGDKPRRLSDEYGMNPTWAPGGKFAVHAGPDIGTTFALKAITAAKTGYPLPAVSLTRGARRFVFQNGARSIVVLKGDIRHKDLWLIDLGSGAERRLTQLPADFEVRDFDMSPDGNEIVLERVQDRSDIALMELKSP